MPLFDDPKEDTSEKITSIAGLPQDIWGEIIGYLHLNDIQRLNNTAKASQPLINSILKQKLKILTQSKNPHLWRSFLLAPDMKSVSLYFPYYYDMSLDHCYAAFKPFKEANQLKEIQEFLNKVSLNLTDYFECDRNIFLTTLKSDALTNKELALLIRCIELTNDLELKIKNIMFQYLLSKDNLIDEGTIISNMDSQALLKFFAEYLNKKKTSVKDSQKISKKEVALLKKLPINYLQNALRSSEYQTNEELLNLVIFAIAQGHLDNILSSQQLIDHANKSHENSKFIMQQKIFFAGLPAATRKAILINANKKIIDTVATLIPSTDTIRIISGIKNASDKAKLIKKQLDNLTRAERLLTTYPGIQKHDSAIIQAKYQALIHFDRRLLTKELAKTIPFLKFKYVAHSILLGSFIALMPILIMGAFTGLILGSLAVLPFFVGLAIFGGCCALFAIQFIRMGCCKPVGHPHVKSQISLESAQRYLKENSDGNSDPIVLTTIPEIIDPLAAILPNNDNASHLPSPVTAGTLAIANKDSKSDVIPQPKPEFPGVGPSTLPIPNI